MVIIIGPHLWMLYARAVWLSDVIMMLPGVNEVSFHFNLHYNLKYLDQLIHSALKNRVL